MNKILKEKHLAGNHNAINFCEKWKRNELIYIKAFGDFPEIAKWL